MKPALRDPGRAGVTLLELLLVMAILAVVLGGGLGMFAALDVGKRQAAGVVKSTIRIAQNTALATQSPARVRIDPGEDGGGTVTAEAMRVVGTWRFEDRSLKGAFGLDGTLREGRFFEDGWTGDALAFAGRPGSTAEIGVHLDPAFDLANGFSISCVVWNDGGGRLLEIGERVVRIDVNAAGQVRGGFAALVEEDGKRQKGGDVLVECAPGLVSAGRWTRLELEYDRRRLVLIVDGVPVAAADETAPVWRVDGPLRISHPRLPFAGAIDDLVVRAVLSDEVAVLPDTVSFAPGTPREIRFDAGGALDRRYHRDPVLLELVHADGSREGIAVGVYGTVQ